MTWALRDDQRLLYLVKPDGRWKTDRPSIASNDFFRLPNSPEDLEHHCQEPSAVFFEKSVQYI